MRQLSVPLLNKIENDVNQWHNFWADRGFREFGVRLSVLMCHESHRHWFADDLLQAAALIWAQLYAIQSSKSLSSNHFHLAHRMPSLMREARPVPDVLTW